MKRLIIFLLAAFSLFSCKEKNNSLWQEMVQLEKKRVLTLADQYLKKEIKTITSANCERSSGGIHDFYSEGDYWWPDRTNVGGPYIRRDGLTNPNNFTAHRKLMRNLSLVVPSLVSAYLITEDEKYAQKAIDYLNAWFVNEETKMNPNMLYSQAIFGRVTGRGIGIIDAIHLVEVVKAAMILEEKGILKGNDLEAIKSWFADFNTWITTHPYGLDEKNNGNNHSTCWAMQVAMFAQFTGNDSLTNSCIDFYKTTLLPEQMTLEGSFPKEMARTKPYGYSLFNLDAMYTLVHILAEKDPSIWAYQTHDHLHLKKAVDFMFPYIANKDSWSLPPDVMYFEDWPMRHCSLLFAYQAFGDDNYFDLWKTLNPYSYKDEVLRNYFIRQPLLWVD